MPGLIPANGLSQGQMALGGLAEGLKTGLLAYRDKTQQDFENRRANALLSLAAKKEGFDFDPSNPSSDSTGLLDTDLSRAMSNQKLAGAQAGAAKSGYETRTYDPDSDVSKRAKQFAGGILNKVKPGSSVVIPEGASAAETNSETGLLKPFVTGELGAQSRAAQIDALTGRQVNRQDKQAHQKVLQRLASNPALNSRLTQIQNLDNAMSIVTDSQNLTPQQIDDFQQAIRRNLGIQGTSGVDERGKTYINTLGLNADRFEQFLTGKPVDIAKDSALVKHIQDLGRIERTNAQKQYQTAIGRLTSGNESVYARNPELKDDLNNAINAYSAPPTPETKQVQGGNGLLPAADKLAGKIKVSNGKETLAIDPSHLQDAMKDGYQQVK